MEKIVVIGCPGSGKSTFARKLRDKTGLPLYYLDQMWHRPDKTNVLKEEFDVKLTGILKSERWILDGNYNRTLEMRLKKCDTVFLLDLPLDVCIRSAESRIGKKREDMPWIEDEFEEEFRQWILNFPQDTLLKIYSLLEQYKNEADITIFKSRDEVCYPQLRVTISPLADGGTSRNICGFL